MFQINTSVYPTFSSDKLQIYKNKILNGEILKANKYNRRFYIQKKGWGNSVENGKSGNVISKNGRGELTFEIRLLRPVLRNQRAYSIIYKTKGGGS